MGCVVETNLAKFKKLSDLIVTNRLDKSLKDIEHKTYTRDIFNDNCTKTTNFNSDLNSSNICTPTWHYRP